MSRTAFSGGLFAAVLGWTALSEGADRLVLVAGGGSQPTPALAREAKLKEPFGVDFAKSGDLFLVELGGGRVLRIAPDGILSTYGGTGEAGDSGDGGPVSEAVFRGMHGLVILPDGDLAVADTWNRRVRRIETKTGIVRPLAGTGKDGDTVKESHALEADFGGIYGIALAPNGEALYLTDLDRRKIRRVDLKTGIVATVAGNGKKGVPEDGAAAVEAPLVDPRAATVAADGSVYVLERGGNALRVVSPEGRIRTVVGTGKAGYSPEGGPALSCMLRGPKHLCVDRDGTVLIADTENHAIFRYDPKGGTLRRIAGTGKRGGKGLNGPPLQAELAQPHGVAVSPQGEIYVVDSANNRLLKIERTQD